MKSCDTFIPNLNKFRDGTLDDDQRNLLQDHLEQCASCRKIVDKNEALERAIKDQVDSWDVPESLLNRVENSTLAERSSNKKLFQPHWAVAAMLFLAVGLITILMHPNFEQTEQQVATELVNEFHTFVISQRDLDYSNKSSVAIQDWFTNKVDFRAPKPIYSSNVTLAGARLCNMFNQRVASYMYRSDGSWVSLYIMKSTPFEDAEQSHQAIVQGYGYFEWQRDGLFYSLVGDVEVDQLEDLAHELQAT